MEQHEQERLRSDVEAFCQALRPIEDRCYLERSFNDQLVPLARKHDLLGMIVPLEYGGRGADAVTYARCLARIGREGSGVRTFFSGHTSIGQYPILRFGTDEQRQRYLPASIKGDVILAFALTERDAGSNPREMTSTYERVGDDYVIHGNKYLISNGGIADAVVLFANATQGGRMTAFIVETNREGFHKSVITDKCGMPTCSTGEFELARCRVPAESRLGEEGHGFRIAMQSLVSGRLSVAAGCLGVIEDCLAEAIAYAKIRSQHGKLIGRHQLVQEHIAAIEMARVTTETLVMRAAEAKDTGERGQVEREKGREGEREIKPADSSVELDPGVRRRPSLVRRGSPDAAASAGGLKISAPADRARS